MGIVEEMAKWTLVVEGAICSLENLRETVKRGLVGPRV